MATTHNTIATHSHTVAWPRVSVIVPTLNEEKNLPLVLKDIPTWVYEVIVVDGFSTDNTIQVARELIPSVKIVMQDRRGKGNALKCGFRAATGDIIVMIDADGSTDPKEIPAFVEALLAGADYAKGSRFAKGGGTSDMSLLRMAGNWGFVALVRLFFGGHYTDLCYGYNAFWRHALSAVMPTTDGFEVETHMNIRALRHHLKIAEVPSFEADRIFGESHLNTWKDGKRVLKTIFRELGESVAQNKPEIGSLEGALPSVVWNTRVQDRSVGATMAEAARR